MEHQPTCGKGLAESSVLPAKLGELTASMAESLERFVNLEQDLMMFLQKKVEQDRGMLG
jgi:hypothetical protein